MTRGEAKRLRALIEQLATTFDDETALTGIQLEFNTILNSTSVFKHIPRKIVGHQMLLPHYGK